MPVSFIYHIPVRSEIEKREELAKNCCTWNGGIPFFSQLCGMTETILLIFWVPFGALCMESAELCFCFPSITNNWG
jgi:hypothetical protein